MKNSIQKFQIFFLVVLYAVAFVFFHIFPEKTDASSPRAHQPATANSSGVSAAD